MTPEISVIMSVYNGERYLRQALDSIRDQIFTDFEFIVFDDGSTDRTRSILETFDDKRIVLLKSDENIGLPKALNRCLAKAQGTYIARMDADDISDPYRLKKQLTVLRNDPAVGVLFTCYRLIDQYGETTQDIPIPLSPEAIYMELFFNNCVVHGSAMMRKSLLEEFGGYDESYEATQDYELWNRLKGHARFMMLPEILYASRSHPKAISSQQIDKQTRFYWKQYCKNLDYLTDSRSERWKMTYQDLFRAIQHTEVEQNVMERAEAEMQSMLARICAEAPGFLDPAMLQNAMEIYLHRFQERITVRESIQIDVPALREKLIAKSRENDAVLRKDTLKPSKSIIKKWYQRMIGTPWDVTVMMLSWNRFDMTQLAIETLEKHVSVPYQLLVIDNDSEPEVKAALRAMSKSRRYMKLILLDENLGCSGGRIFSLKHIDTPYVMFLDNDIEVFPGTIEHVLSRLNTDASILAASTNIVFPNGQVHICGGDYWERDGMLQYNLLGAGMAYDDPALGKSAFCHWVNGGATLYRTQALRQYPFDALMKNYYEDLEWCYRLNQLGFGRFYRCVEALCLHHHEDKVPDDITISPEDAKKQSMKYIEPIAYFYKKHEMIIPNLFDFVPELITSENELNTTMGGVFLDCVNRLGSDCVLRAWSGGDLDPLFSEEVEDKKAWQAALQDCVHDAR